MDTLKMHTPDLTQEHIAKLAELFPACVTESRDEQGRVRRAIDFDQLRQELSDRVVEGPQERYHLNWPGKREALLAASAPIAKTLRPCRQESVNFDTTQNIFIEGDNLDALKLLQETYLNKVKMIYIDPPYNTGREFIYDDDFAEDADEYLLRSGQASDAGARLVANTEANGRYHSDWLSMMYPRLRLSRSLLRDDGVLFVSIDDNEVSNLRRLCDEVFGETNFIATIIWQKVYSPKNTANWFSDDHDYVLVLLQETYLNKVKMIYIDPPYNTGKDFIYSDDFACDASEYLLRSEQLDAEGQRLVANTESNGRFHSDWLSMMLPRLRLARTLLADDGVIFISIDEHELHNLIKVGSEVFGDANFVGTFAVQCNPRGRHLDRFIATTHDYVVVFARNALNPRALAGMEKSGRMLEEYGREDGKGKYRLLGLRNRNQAFNPDTRPNLYYPLYVNPADGSVGLARSAAHSDEVFPDAPDRTKTCWTWGKEKVEREGGLLVAEKSGSEWRVYRKDYLQGDDGDVALTMPKSLWLEKDMTNDYGRSRIKSLFGSSVMDFPKSVQLLERLVEIGCASEGLVVDFFAGSATTADAVMCVNARDGVRRQFLLVQLPEECEEGSKARSEGFTTIADLAKDRIRRAFQAIANDASLQSAPFDGGFRVLKVDSSNMKDVYYRPDEATPALLGGHVDNIKDDRTDEDLLFQVLLDWGVDLSLPIAKEQVRGKPVYFVDTNALAACFAAGIDEAFVKELAARKPLRAVFRDAGYGSDDVKINVEQIFKQLSPGTDVKTL